MDFTIGLVRSLRPATAIQKMASVATVSPAIVRGGSRGAQNLYPYQAHRDQHRKFQPQHQQPKFDRHSNRSTSGFHLKLSAGTKAGRFVKHE